MHEKCKYLTNKGFVEQTFVWYMNDSSTYFNKTLSSRVKRLIKYFYL